MQGYRKLTAILILILTCATADLTAAGPDMLGEIPSDAAAIVVTRPIGELNSRINAFLTQVGLPPENQLDLPTMIPGQLGLATSIDDSRGLAVAIGDLTQPRQTLLAFIPVTEPDSALDGLRQAEQLTATDSPNIHAMTSNGLFVTTTARHLVIAGGADRLQKLSTTKRGLELNAADQAILKDSLIAAKINLGPLMPMFKQQALAGLNQPGMEQMGAAQDINEMMIERITDLDSVFLAVNLLETAVNLTMNFQPVAGSPMADFLAKHETIDASALAPLPANEFVMAYAFSLNPASMTNATDAVMDLLTSEATTAGTLSATDAAQAKELTLEWLKIGATRGALAEYLTPTGSSEGMRMMGLAQVEDVDRALDLMKESAPLMNKVMKESLNITTTYDDNAGKIGPRTYTEWSFDMSTMDLPPEAMEALKSQWGGSTTFTEQFCRIDDQRMGIGLGSSSLEELLAFIDSGQTGLSANPAIAQSAANLPQKANVIAFVHLGNAVRKMLNQPTTPPEAMMMMGMFAQLQSVIGTTATFSPDGLRSDVTIPADLIQFAVTMAMQFSGMMGPGAAGPPPATGM